MKPRLAILISGRGSNMASILEAANRESWHAEVALVLSNKPQAGGLQTAEKLGIKTAVLDHRNFRGRREEFDAELASILQDHKINLVILAGFMRILGPNFTRPFSGRILNIHPSLLPLYPGLETHQRAIDAGDSVAGCTVHLVDETLDGGEPLAQAKVPILPGDDAEALAARVLVEEHQLYPRVVREFIDSRLKIGMDPDPISGSLVEVEK
jgi:phosphoribosylglycinamide formyltransferase-1